MTFLSALLQYKFVIVFYVLIILIVVLNKKKFDFQAKFIALYRTKVGIKLMHKCADRFGPVIRGCGYAGIFLGYAGMALIVYFIFNGFYQLLFIPDAPAVLSPVIPGVPIPGSPIFVPFWYGIIALFVVVVVHEFGHGIVSAAHKIKVKHSGIVFFGPLVGAFVEPDEKQLQKKGWWVQQSMFAAGPVANAVLAVIVWAIVILALIPVMNSSVETQGFFFQSITDGYPALEAGVQAGVVYDTVNGVFVEDATYLSELLATSKPGDIITVGNENLSHVVVTAAHPDYPDRAFLGVIGVNNYTILKDSVNPGWYNFLTIIVTFLSWVFVLSLGIGLANLLPLGPVDGGRMLHQTLEKKMSKKKALYIFSRITALILALILILVAVPIIKALI